MSGIGTIEHTVTPGRANAPRSWTRLVGVESMGERMCSVEGCPGQAKTRGWCGMHYQRWFKHGDPSTVSRAVRPDHEAAAAVMRAANVEPDGPYPGRKKIPWPGTCTICGSKVAPRLANILSGQGACNSCVRSRRPHGEDHPLWKDVVTYKAAHQRVQRIRGLASDYACADCGEPANEWSYVGGSTKELVTPNGWKYSPDAMDFEARCRPCHRAYDRGQRSE
jgi:hypothetical protein